MLNCPAQRNRFWFSAPCRFEARYDYGQAPQMDIEGRGSFVSLIEATKSKKYVHDICVRCGAIVDRPVGKKG